MLKARFIAQAFGLARDLYVMHILILYRVFESNFRTLRGDGLCN
ncbi:hypothetical protein APHCRT_0267 [Anaplasma phagocytophilum str. CRT53-1]|uniref:Uncharacterized protein n=5 Tax=Anaplasma phagocytophilum TaxID=948 RepID=Q2GLA5_ANAPZ|nr:hypothetical protein [Anaplasma phagocytophilum]ABD43239.1 hypothetical protein APH_0227 [Anaplasma phagocytophilum str. HZ]KJV59561.1 hypothetical protein APHWEB_0284 [Anaplasma phagocytophilum str. Webster]KJV67239.1 hypothetical protein APHNP_1249 [Anaplasma phagocytophilum str. ApNP]KJV68234.1 hypothetical protein EPHNCH_0449 [Anaplasma phagocytophilum str. NCH-1]KJV82444.1 hypothetical protein APHHGE2_0462 [Anaplasma phagocytophilum str. HGE2]KJV85515.1 hypothetical protein APHWI1_123